MSGGQPDHLDRIAAALRYWRQGDLALDEVSFFHVADLRAPLSDAAQEEAQGQADAAGALDVVMIESEVKGLVVLTQTCDIVRDCRERPYVEVAPLVQVDDDGLQEVRRGTTPRYAYVPAVADRGMVADLDRTMTVEKSLLLLWKRTPGCRGDTDAMAFAQALARKRERFAFPDEFVRGASKLRGRITSKHDRNSDEGALLRSLLQIRVRAAPSWDAPDIELVFWFILRDEADVPVMANERLEAWKAALQLSGPFGTPEFRLVKLADMSAQDYAESAPLDLDYLSGPDR